MKHHAECSRANYPDEDLLCNCGLLAVRDLMHRAETAERERDEARASNAELIQRYEKHASMGRDLLEGARARVAELEAALREIRAYEEGRGSHASLLTLLRLDGALGDRRGDDP